MVGRQGRGLDVYSASLLTRKQLDPLTHRAEFLWSRDNTVSTPFRRAHGGHLAAQCWDPQNLDVLRLKSILANIHDGLVLNVEEMSEGGLIRP